jgi:tRNA pseudouridine38-40 synthase
MKNILLTIEYDGTDFAGWQRQTRQRSVQGEVERGLSLLFQKPIEVFAASRTDAGVHAYAQKANFIIEQDIPVENIRKALNGMLPADIKIIRAEEVSMDFHARFSATGKKYVYKLVLAEERRVFDRNYAYTVTRRLNVEAMREAASYFLGTHDFKPFSGNNGQPRKATIRTIEAIEILAGPENTFHIAVTGTAFLYKMVRMMTGSLLSIGYGKYPPEIIMEILEGKRKRIGNTAKPQGLYLMEVYYNRDK